METNQVPASVESTPAAAPVPAVLPMLTAEAVAAATARGMADYHAAKEAADRKERAESLIKKYLTQPETGIELTVAWTVRVIIIAGVAMLALYAGDKFLRFVKSRREAAEAASAAGAVLGD